MEAVTFMIRTINRVGMTHDVLECLFERKMDITAMEVVPNVIYLKLPAVERKCLENAVDAISRVSGVTEIRIIRELPSETRENQIRLILSTLSEGILLLDGEWRIREANQAAERLLEVEKGSLTGKPAEQVWPEAIRYVKRCIEDGKEIRNASISFRKLRRTVHFLVSCLAVTPLTGELGSCILIFRDMKEVQDLIRSVKRNRAFTFDDILHRSEEMARCIATARKIASSGATVVLYGESGTGKELFARALHFESSRADGPFIPINCSAIPDSLLESELFGYEEGSFTGAVKGGKKGLVELAHGGTLFLDEIGELPLHLQAKLLRMLEERAIRRVGGDRMIPVDIRVIVATNRDLASMIMQGKFRGDLFYRLNVIPIHIPPLRERKSDIPLLTEFFVKKYCDLLGRPTLSLTDEAMELLIAHHWPGNVRELQNVLERAVTLCPENENTIRQDMIGPDALPASAGVGTTGKGLKDHVEAYERTFLLRTLRQCKTVRQAAKRLGISHTALLRKIQKYGLAGDE
jgi:transcriptional regulator of aroF, aroG, tyrA and aromatic amino acid transport